MEKKVTFDCKNNGRVVEVPFATTLEEAYAYTGVQMKYGPVGVKVNNKEELSNSNF